MSLSPRAHQSTPCASLTDFLLLLTPHGYPTNDRRCQSPVPLSSVQLIPPGACAGSALTECSDVQPFKLRNPVNLDPWGFVLAAFSGSLFQPAPLIADLSFFFPCPFSIILVLHPCVCVCVVGVTPPPPTPGVSGFVYLWHLFLASAIPLDAFAPSPGDGPAAAAVGPAADAFAGSGG